MWIAAAPQLKARMLQIALDPSTRPLPTSGLSITARSSMQFFFLVAAEAFTEHINSLNAKARRYLASREKAELRAATT